MPHLGRFPPKWLHMYNPYIYILNVYPIFNCPLLNSIQMKFITGLLFGAIAVEIEFIEDSEYRLKNKKIHSFIVFLFH